MRNKIDVLSLSPSLHLSPSPPHLIPSYLPIDSFPSRDYIHSASISSDPQFHLSLTLLLSSQFWSHSTTYTQVLMLSSILHMLLVVAALPLLWDNIIDWEELVPRSARPSARRSVSHIPFIPLSLLSRCPIHVEADLNLSPDMCRPRLQLVLSLRAEYFPRADVLLPASTACSRLSSKLSLGRHFFVGCMAARKS